MSRIVLLSIFYFTTTFIVAQEVKKVNFSDLSQRIQLAKLEGKFEQMLQLALQGMQAALERNSNQPDTIYANYIQSAGFGYEMLGEYDKAYKSYTKTKTILEETIGTNNPKYAQALANLGAYYWTIEDYQKAEPFYLKAQKICRNSIGENNETFASIQNDLALLYHSIGEYEEAEILYLKNIAYDKKVSGEQNFNYAYSLNNLASLYWEIDQFDKAEPLFIQAREIWENISGAESPDYALVTNNLANLYMQKEAYQKAVKLYPEVVKIDKATYGENHPTYALSINNLASAYRRTKEYKKAEALYLKARNIWLKKYGPKHPKLVFALNNLSSLYTEMNNYSKAEAYLKQSFQITQEGSVNYNLSILMLHNFSNLYYYKNQLDTAFVYGVASLVYNSKNKRPIFDIFPQNIQDFRLTNALILFCQQLSPKDLENLASLEYQNTGFSNKAFTMLLSISKAQYRETLEVGLADRAKKHLILNYHLAQIAIRSNEATLIRFSENQDKLNIIRNNVTFATFGLDAAKILDEEKYLNEAFSFSEQNKSILLAEAFQGEKAQSIMDLPDTLAQQEANLKRQKDALQKEQYEATNPDVVSTLRSQQNQLNLKIDDFLKRIEKDYPQYHALKYKNIISTTTEIQESLDSKTALLEYFITDSVTFLFSITQTQVDITPLRVPKKVLKKKVKTLQKALTNYKLLTQNPAVAYQNYTTVAHWFYKNILAPGLQAKGIENLVIITDGALGHIPFEVFLKTYTQNAVDYTTLDYLINHYNISYSYSATLWKENLNTAHKTNNQQLLACAADYTTPDSSLLNMRSFYEYQTRTNLQELPSAVEEVQTLSQDFEGFFLTGEASNEANFKRLAENYSVIHLAMHGILHRRQPILSSLAFTENLDSLENNFLQAYEIAHLQLNADLVVLSACETGYGAFEQGEGVLSLARSFMYAGTPSLIVSLWQINDYSTAIIMQHFYTYLSQGYSKDRALSQAKLDYLKEAKGFMAHPVFWSPFIQLGNAKPIELKIKNSNTRWLFPVLLGCSVLLFILFKLFSKKLKE